MWLLATISDRADKSISIIAESSVGKYYAGGHYTDSFTPKFGFCSVCRLSATVSKGQTGKQKHKQKCALGKMTVRYWCVLVTVCAPNIRTAPQIIFQIKKSSDVFKFFQRFSCFAQISLSCCEHWKGLHECLLMMLTKVTWQHWGKKHVKKYSNLGMTWQWQVLDIIVNKPFKERIN